MMMGLSLKNVALHISSGKKKIFDEQGEMLFTHFGISGPLVIKASAYIHRYIGKDIDMYIDLKPAMDRDMLDARLLKDFKKYANKDFKNSLGDLLPIIWHMQTVYPSRGHVSHPPSCHLYPSLQVFHMKSCQKRTEPVQFHQKQWNMMQVEPVSCHITHLPFHRLKTTVRDQAFYLRW